MAISIGLVSKSHKTVRAASNVNQSAVTVKVADNELFSIKKTELKGLRVRQPEDEILVINAASDSDYLLIDKNGEIATNEIKASKTGNDLWIYTEANSDKPSVIIKGYYANPGELLITQTEGSINILQAPLGQASISALESSSMTSLEVGQTIDYSLSWQGSSVPEFDSSWLLVGALGLGAGVALGKNSSSKHSSHSDSSHTKVSAPKVDLNNGKGLFGTGDAGTTIIVLDANGKQVASTLVDNNGKWAINGNPLKEGEKGTIFAKSPDGSESSKTEITGGKQTAAETPIVTQNDEFTLAGTTEKGYAVRVIVNYSGKDTVINATVDANGKWIIDKPLPDGALIQIIARDPAGNDSTPVIINVGNNTAPLSPLILENNTVLSGTAVGKGKVILFDQNGVEIASTDIDSSGKWKFTDNPFSSGTKGYIQVVDNAGRGSEKVEIVGNLASTLPTPTVSVNNSKGLSGKTTPDSTVTIKNAAGDVVGTVKADNKGNWSFAKNPLAEGEKGTITASIDGQKDSKPHEITGGDQTPPNKPVIEVNNAGVLSGTGEPNSGLIFKNEKNEIIAKGRVDADGKWSISPNPFTKGTKGTVLSKDSAGNTSEELAIESGAKEAPQEPEILINNGSELSGKGLPNSQVIIRNEKGEVVSKVTVDANGIWTSKPNPIKAGEIGKISSADQDGNESTGFKLTGAHSPASAPTISLDKDTGQSDTDSITNNGKILVTELGGANRWEYSIDGGKTWHKGGNGAFMLKDGTYLDAQVQVRAFDKSENVSLYAKLDKVTVDTVPPAAVKLTILGADLGKVVVNEIETGATWEYSTDGGKNWHKGSGDSFQLATGKYAVGDILVKQTDIAGNTSTASFNEREVQVNKTLETQDDTTEQTQLLANIEPVYSVIGKILALGEQLEQDTISSLKSQSAFIDFSLDGLLASESAQQKALNLIFNEPQDQNLSYAELVEAVDTTLDAYSFYDISIANILQIEPEQTISNVF